MPTTPKFLFVALVAVASIVALPLQAQEEQAPPPGGTIYVEQKSEIEAFGKWTMLQPTHESFDRTDTKLSMPNMVPGKYTFQTESPSGTSTHIDIFLGDDIIASSETPQISFELLDKMTVKLVVTYTLTIFGKVGVNSEPAGIPYTLRGPDEMIKIGVTPVEYSRLPIGNYSVTFRPEGCPQPPAQSGLLQKEDRVNFMVKLVCGSFRAVKGENEAEHISAKVGGENVTFTDVPVDSWFGAYVLTVAKRAIMAGYTEKSGKLTGKFGPGDHVTVAQLAKIAHTVNKINENLVMTAPLNPRARGQWFTRYIASAEEQGWLVFADGTVDPNRPATRGEVVITLLQVFDIPMHWPKGNVFTDVERKTPYSGAIETAAEEEIVTGSTDATGKSTGLFHPTDSITRAEIAKILITVYEKYQTTRSSSSAPDS